jgi:hypothetical protein
VVIGALTLARSSDVDVRTSSAAVAQVWRGGASQVGVSHALRGAEEVPLDRAMARRVGELLARSGTSDVIDAAVVLLAATGDIVLTSDPVDVARLADAAGLRIEVVPV